MDKKYIGLTDEGRYDEFESDSFESARPSMSGYERVWEVQNNGEKGAELKD